MARLLYVIITHFIVKSRHHVIREIEYKPLRMINSLNSEARLQGKNIGLPLFQFTSFRNVTALDLNFEYCFEKKNETQSAVKITNNVFKCA